MLRPHQKPHPGQPLALPLQKPPARDACRASPRPTDVLMPTRGVRAANRDLLDSRYGWPHPGGSTKLLLARRRTAPSGDVPLKTNKFEARIGRFFWIPRVDPVFRQQNRRSRLPGGALYSAGHEKPSDSSLEHSKARQKSVPTDKRGPCGAPERPAPPSSYEGQPSLILPRSGQSSSYGMRRRTK